MKAKAEKKHETGKKFLAYAETHMPAFDEVFDEQTFYIFAGCVALGSCVLAFIASRFLTLTDPDDPDEILRRVRKWKIKNTDHGHPTMDGPDSPADNASSNQKSGRSFHDYSDEESSGDDSEEERELLRRVEDKFFADKRNKDSTAVKLAQ